jgi:hypothetical protein
MSKKPFTKLGLVEWLKVKALSSSPSTVKGRGGKGRGGEGRGGERRLITP